MYKYRNRRFRVEKDEKESPKDISQKNQREINTDTNKENRQRYEVSPSQRIAYKKGEVKINDSNQFDDSDRKNYYTNTDKNSMSSNIHKAKSRNMKEDNEISDFDNTSKKLRNTMTGLNNDKMKYESGLIDIILKVEKDNVDHYLKGDLAEMYHDINKDNYDFKNNVFLANVDNFEKKTGIFDKKPIIPYNCNEDISYKLDKYPRTNEIIEKFTEKTKTFTNYD
jgi:hypothetical protein